MLLAGASLLTTAALSSLATKEVVPAKTIPAIEWRVKDRNRAQWKNETNKRGRNR